MNHVPVPVICILYCHNTFYLSNIFAKLQLFGQKDNVLFELYMIYNLY